ncbi:MAG: STAS domain-containing protein [Halopseudomonas sp.]
MDVELNAEHDGSQCRLSIAGELCIYDAAELKPLLLDHLARCTELELNLADVGEIDCAGFQLLYLLKREALAENKQLRLVNHSQAALDMLGLLNMEAYFGDPVVLAS